MFLNVIILFLFLTDSVAVLEWLYPMMMVMMSPCRDTSYDEHQTDR